jgi:hypothetical protein
MKPYSVPIRPNHRFRLLTLVSVAGWAAVALLVWGVA